MAFRTPPYTPPTTPTLGALYYATVSGYNSATNVASITITSGPNIGQTVTLANFTGFPLPVGVSVACGVSFTGASDAIIGIAVVVTANSGTVTWVNADNIYSVQPGGDGELIVIGWSSWYNYGVDSTISAAYIVPPGSEGNAGVFVANSAARSDLTVPLVSAASDIVAEVQAGTSPLMSTEPVPAYVPSQFAYFDSRLFLWLQGSGYYLYTYVEEVDAYAFVLVGADDSISGGFYMYGDTVFMANGYIAAGSGGAFTALTLPDGLTMMAGGAGQIWYSDGTNLYTKPADTTTAITPVTPSALTGNLLCVDGDGSCWDVDTSSGGTATQYAANGNSTSYRGFITTSGFGTPVTLGCWAACGNILFFGGSMDLSTVDSSLSTGTNGAAVFQWTPSSEAWEPVYADVNTTTVADNAVVHMYWDVGTGDLFFTEASASEGPLRYCSAGSAPDPFSS